MDLMNANFFIRPPFSVTMFMVNKTCQGNAFFCPSVGFFFLIRSVCWGRQFSAGLFGFIRVISEVCSVRIIFVLFCVTNWMEFNLEVSWIVQKALDCFKLRTFWDH